MVSVIDSSDETAGLTEAQIERYKRNILLSEVGLGGQLILNRARVLIVGAGGLGAPVALYLAAAGVGTIGIVDHDRVDLSNLQRQVLYSEEQVGALKVVAACARLARANSDVKIETHCVALDEASADELVAAYDIVVDCTDNFAVRYAINDACVRLGKPFVYGSIYRFEGQVSFFQPGLPTPVSGKSLPGTQPCYRCLYPQSPQQLIPTCQQAGVLGAIAGVVGSLQATEVLKYLLGQGDLLIGRLLLFDGLAMSFSTIKYAQASGCLCAGGALPVAAKANACSSSSSSSSLAALALDAVQLMERIKTGARFALLDVRTLTEHQAMRFKSSRHIPLDELESRLAELNVIDSSNETLIVYCRSGARSATAVDLLLSRGRTNVLNLSGGILAFCREYGEDQLESDASGGFS